MLKNTLRPLVCLLAALFLSALTTSAAPEAPGGSHRFEVGEKDFLLDGARLQIRCGEIHFARVPREYWRHRLQMIKAMGLNCVSVYLFWNYHEWTEGRYDWEGQKDAAAFCRMAQEEGLWVLLRPGPYVCAEWEGGGLPWWLLKHRDNFLRTRDPRFMEPVKRWFREVHRVLGPLQASLGGPILMVQVENEYGFFGKDADYMRALQTSLQEFGFVQPFFACNPTSVIAKSHIPGLFSVVNFGADPAGAFRVLRKVQPSGPLKCGEFYPGWFDTWGTPHKVGEPKAVVENLRLMLEAGASFSLYMAHGGTSFGFWGGCDRPFRPDTSSYDYDAPISEAGWVTPKFDMIRELMGKHLLPGENLPPVPAALPVASIPAFRLTQASTLMESLPPVAQAQGAPETFERLGVPRGYVVYRCSVPAGPAASLEAADLRDFAWVFLDGKNVGVMDRRFRHFRVALPERAHESRLEVLVYAMGRVNFGQEMHDRKGLRGPVLLREGPGRSRELTEWSSFGVELGDKAPVSGARRSGEPATGPAYWVGSFEVEKPADSFLDLSSWGMGAVWVNGHALGRFWNIGPTQTLYVPGAWLKTGKNDVCVLDFVGPGEPVLSGLERPILGTLRPELDFSKREQRSMPPPSPSALVLEGQFAPGAERQELRFPKPAAGRQLCIEILDSQDGGPNAAIAEIELIDDKGERLNQSSWTVAFASTEECALADGSALNAINGQISDCWLSAQSAPVAQPPHRLVIDLGGSTTAAGFRYTPRQGGPKTPGRIKTYRIYFGDFVSTEK